MEKVTSSGQVKEFILEEPVPYVGEALKRLRNEVLIVIYLKQQMLTKKRRRSFETVSKF